MRNSKDPSRARARRLAARRTDHEKLALEARLVREGKIYPRAHYMPRGRFRGIIAVALALFLGIFVGLGALIGGGVFVASNVKLSEFAGIENWISSTYTDRTLLQFISEVASDLGDGVENLGQIAKYTPQVNVLLETLEENLQAVGIDFGSTVQERFLDTPFDKIGDFFINDVLGPTELGKFVNLDDDMLLALCYGEEGIDYTIENGKIVPTQNPQRKPLTFSAFLKGNEEEKPGENNELQEALNSVRLGTLLGLNKNVDTEQKINDNAMMYALCYGKRGVDYEYDAKAQKIIVLSDLQENGENVSLADEKPENGNTQEKYVHTFPTTLDALMKHSNDVIDAIELGAALGLDQPENIADKESDIKKNAVTYSLAYGSRGTDWELKTEGNKAWIEMLDGHDEEYPTKMGSFTNGSSALIQRVEVEAAMSVEVDSKPVMHFLAYGPEMEKGEPFEAKEGSTEKVAPWKEENGKFYDKNGQLVDENGYLLDKETNWYPTETVTEKNEQGEEKQKIQYKGGATFIYEYEKDKEGHYVEDEEGNRTIIGIIMLPDPDKEGFDPADEATWIRYPKKKIADINDKDSDLLGDMKLGVAMETTSEDSSLMQALQDWTVNDLKDQEKIESLKVSDVLGQDAGSNIMRAFEKRGTTLGQLKDQETIDSLKLSEVLEIEESGPNQSSSILLAMQDWQISDLENQNRIERLKLSQVLAIDANSSKIMQAMKDWRIGELSEQEKIDSLTLGDVLAIDDTSPLLLKTLATSQLGELSERVDNIRLAEMMDEEELENNKILKHLKDSTLDSLADDIKTLSVDKVFGDQMYSYMKIEEKELTLYDSENNQPGSTTQKYTVTYEWLYNTYFKHVKTEPRTASVSGEDDDITVDVDLYNYNFAYYNGSDENGNPVENAFVFRPTAYTFGEGETLVTERALKENTSKKVEAHFFLHSEQPQTNPQRVPEGAKIVRDTSFGKEGSEAKAEYYYEQEIVLTPHYVYGVYDYVTGSVGATQDINDTAHGGKFLYEGNYYDVIKDGFCDCILVPVPPKEGAENAGEEAEQEFDRIDLEKVLDHYTVNGTKVDFAKKTVTGEDESTTQVDDRTKVIYNGQTLLVRHGTKHVEGAEDESYDYMNEKILVDRYYTAAGDTKLYTEAETTELYYAKTATDETQLDRYLTGVWHLLLGKQLTENEALAKKGVTNKNLLTPFDYLDYQTSTPILDVDSMISGVSDSMKDAKLTELWFHGFLDETPYADLTKNNLYESGIVFHQGVDDQGHDIYHIVKNLSEVSLSETLALVKALTRGTN